MAFTSLTKADIETLVNKLVDKVEAKVPSIFNPAEEVIRAKLLKLVDDVAADLGIVD